MAATQWNFTSCITAIITLPKYLRQYFGGLNLESLQSQYFNANPPCIHRLSATGCYDQLGN